MAVKCILTGQTPSVLDGVTENIQNQLNSKQDKVTATGFLVGSTNGTVTGVEDTFVSYDSLSDVEAASSPNDWHIGDNGNWYFGAMDSGKSSKGTDGTDGTNGAPGKDGSDGKSAYESAQDGGYTGTEEQFNADLAGVSDKANSDDIPTWLSELADDAYHRLVTDTEKTTWDDKQSKITASGILKGNGSGGVSAATEGLDYAAPSYSTDFVLTADNWSDGVQSIPTIIGIPPLSASTNGSVRISQDATDEQFAAWCAAQPRVTAQTTSTITIKAAGTVPTIDIPVEVLIV